MAKDLKVLESLQTENAALREKLEEAEETLRALRSGEIDALIVGEQVYTLEGSGAESNRFRGEMLAQINEAVIATDPGGRVIYINEAAEKLYHADPGTALGLEQDKVFSIRWLRDDDEKEFDAALLADGNWRGENVHYRNDGTEFYAESTVCFASHGASNGDGGEVGRLLVVRDITQRKRAERTIDQNRKMLSLAMKSSRMGVWEQDIIGGTTWWSEELEAIFGLEKGGFLGTEQHYFDLIVEADRESSRRAVESALAEHRDYSFEFRFRHASGEIRWMEGRGQALYSEDGEPVKIYGVGIDITDRKKLEERSRFLTELDRTVQQIGEPDEVMAVTAQMLADHLGADRCAYAEVEDENVFVITGDYTRDVPSIVGRWPVADFGRECARQMLANEPYVVLDTDNDPRIGVEDLAAYRATTIRAVICVPLHKDGKFTAAMAVHQKVPRTWTDAEIELVQVTVNRCWEALERSRVARAVRESDERFRLALSSGAVTVYEQDRDLRYKWVYPEAPYRADLAGKTDEELSPGPHAAERNELKRRVIETGRSERGEVAADVKGIRHWYDLLIEPRTDDAGNIIGVGGTALDITDRKNAELLLATQKQALEMVVGGRPLTEVLEFLVSIVDERGAGQSVGAIMLIDDDGRLHNAASRYLPQPYLDAIEGIAADKAVGTCSAAAATCTTVITPDIAADPKWKKFRHLPLNLGLVAAWSEPIVTADGRILGTFGTYFREKREPTDLERRMVEILAQTASLAIERRRTEDKLAEQKTLLEALTESVLDGILIVSPDGRMLHHNQQFLDIWNFPAEVVELKSDHAALEWAAQQTTDPAAFLGRVDHIYSQPDIQFREEMWMKDGRIFERFGAPVHHGETRLGWVWTFRDITERKASEEVIKQSEQRMRLAMNAGNMYSWEIDAETRDTVVSEDAAQVLGFERTAADLQLQVSTIVHEDDRERTAKALEMAFQTGEFHEQLRFKSPSTGEVVWAESQGTVRRDETGRPVKLYGVTQNITVRKQAEDALLESENRMRLMADSIPQLAWMAEPDGYIFWYNRRWYEFTATDPDQMEGWGWQSVHDPEMLPAVMAEWTKSIETGQPFEMEFPLRGADGMFRWFLTRVNPLRDSDGQIVRWFGTNTDIDELRRIAQDLRSSEARFVKAFNSSPLSITITSLKSGKLLEVNDTFVNITGYSRDESVGKTTAELGLWEKPSDRDEELSTIVNDGSLRDSEYRFRMKDGSQIVGLLSAEFIEIGGEQCALTVIQDITERHRAEKEIRDSEERYRILTETASDAILRINEESTIDFVNSATERVFGYTAAEMLGQPLTMLMPEELRARHRAGLKRYLDTGRRKLNWESIEVAGRHKDGRVFPLEISFGEYNRGDTRFFIGVARDITDRKETEENLRKLNLEIEMQSRIFDTTLSSVTDFVYTFDRDGRFIFSNRPLLDLLEITLEQIVGKNFFDLGYPDDLAERLQTQIQHVFDTGETIRDETPFTGPSGEPGFYEYIFNPVIGADGSVDLVAGTTRDITERKLAEKALRKSEERRHLAQDAGNVGIFDWDIVNDETYWSETMWAFYGEERSEINPDEKFWTNHIHGTDRDRVRAGIREAVGSTSDRYADEYRIVRPDGSIRWIAATARISRDPDGLATRMYGVNLDITGRKEAEEIVKRSEYQLRMVTDTIPALVAYVDNSERYRFVNQKYVEWFGKPREQIIGKTIAEIAGAQAYRVIKPRVDTALAGKEVTFEDELPLKGAGKRFVRVSYAPDSAVDGRVNGFYALISDQTQLKRSEELLRSAEERMGLIVESVTEYAIFAMDTEGRVESWNLGAQSIFGYTPEEIIGLSFEALFVPADVARGVPIREMRIARQSGRALDERWHVRKDGSRFFASGVTMPLYVGGSLTGYAKIATDLTEKQRRADELQRAHDELEVRVVERTKELAETNLALLEEMEEREVAEKQRIDLLRRLVSSQESERRRIARDIHDTLGQRLTALRLKIASLHEAASGDEKFRSRVERLQEISERLDSEVSFMAWELRPSALDDLGLAEAVGTFVNEWSKHYEIPADFHSSNLPHEVSNRETETHLYRITQEALNNIAKHAGAKNVSVVLERRDENLILIIEDDGKGFDPSKLPPPVESGKGLGLLGMGERASLVGGNVEIESAPGKGTTIYARVPFFNQPPGLGF